MAQTTLTLSPQCLSLLGPHSKGLHNWLLGASCKIPVLACQCFQDLSLTRLNPRSFVEAQVFEYGETEAQGRKEQTK